MNEIGDGANEHRAEFSSPNEELFERALELAKKGLNFISRTREIGSVTISTEHGDQFQGGDETHAMVIIEDGIFFQLSIDIYDDVRIELSDLFFDQDEDDDEGFLDSIYADIEIDSFGLNRVSNAQGLAFIDFLETLEQAVADSDSPLVETQEELAELLFKVITAESLDQDVPDPVLQETVDRIKERFERLTLNSPPATSSFIQGLLIESEPTGYPRTLTVNVPITDKERRFEITYLHYVNDVPQGLEIVGLTNGDLMYIEGENRGPEARMEAEKRARVEPRPNNPREYFLRKGYRIATAGDLKKVFDLIKEAETNGIQFAEKGNIDL